MLGGSLRLIAADQAARHPGRNAVTVSALMVGLSIMIGVVVMVRSFRDTVEVWVNETVMADLIVTPQSWLQGKQAGQASRALPGTWRAILSAIDGIAAVDTYRDVHVEAEGQPIVLVSRDLRLHAQRSRYLMIHGDSTAVLTASCRDWRRSPVGSVGESIKSYRGEQSLDHDAGGTGYRSRRGSLLRLRDRRREDGDGSNMVSATMARRPGDRVSGLPGCRGRCRASAAVDCDARRRVGWNDASTVGDSKPRVTARRFLISSTAPSS